jgi:hypothetical protein
MATSKRRGNSPDDLGFSHLALVKHLAPENYVERLLVRPDLIQRSQQFHFRPFNGRHCQVPVTRGDGSLTQEVNDWLPFVGATMRTWLEGNAGSDHILIVVPEMGPVEAVTILHTFRIVERRPSA